MAQSVSPLAEALLRKPPGLATLPPTEGPKVKPGEMSQIESGTFGGGGGGGMPGSPAASALQQYGPGGLVAQQMVTGLLSGNLPWLKPIPQLQGRVGVKDLRSLSRELKK